MTIHRTLFYFDPNDPHQNDDLVAQLYNVEESEVSVMHPLEIYMPRPVVIEAVRDNLKAIGRNRKPSGETDEDRRYITALIQQRIDFLERLKQDPNPHVLIALYPAGVQDDILAGDDDDDDGDPGGMHSIDDFLRDDDLPL